MEVSPKTLREVEFREKMRGYHPEDVDQFLEQVAAGLEVIHDRLRQAVERAQRAEAAAADSGGTDETLRRTLILAQRTADMAVQEAREQAAQILGGAEQQAQALLADAEERARRAHDDAISQIRAELGTLEAVRQRGQQEVDLLNRWVEEHRSHLASTLKEALTVVERAGTLSPPPTSRPIDVAPYATRPGTSLTPPPVSSAVGGYAPGPPSGAVGPVMGGSPSTPPGGVVRDTGSNTDSGPATAAWQLPEGDLRSPGEASGEVQFGSLRRAGETDPSSWDTGPHPAVSDDPVVIDPAEQALDDFFEDSETEEDHRFGGRLRRRR